MIRYESSGSFSDTFSFLDKVIRDDPYSRIEKAAQQGVEALRIATPHDTGITADAWAYEIEKTSGGVTIWYKNTNVVNGFNVAVGLQYGHGTGTGGYVAGQDYINPALKPVFDRIANDVWKEVTNL